MNALPEHRPIPLKGPTLTVKMAGIVAFLVAAAMAGFGLFLHGSLVDTIRSQIQNEAINAARTAAQSELITWTKHYGTIDEGLSATDIQARVDSQTVADFEAYQGDAQRLERIAWNEAKLDRVLGDDTRIVAMEVFRFVDGQRAATVSSAYPGKRLSVAFSSNENLPRVVMGRGHAQEGELSVGENTWHVIRGSYPVLDSAGVQEGEVVVHVHAAAIEEAAAAFSKRVSYAAAAFIVLSLIVAYFVARQITGPMRRLRDDAEAVVAGDLQHRTHPHSTDEVGQLARTFSTLTHWLAHAQEAGHEAEQDAADARRELAAAADVTASLFPRALPDVPGWSLGGLHDREASPGGGTYDVFTMPDGRLGMYVAEASSGGAPGALVAAMARTTLRFAAERHSEPGAVLREVNARLAPDLSGGLNVAVALVVLDTATGEAAIASAGHRPVLHYHREGDGVAMALSEGAALGAVDAATFERSLKVAHVRVAQGDSLVMFASAISILTNPEGEVLGEKRLAALVKQAAELPADGLVDRVGGKLRDYHGGESLGADVTLVAVGRRVNA